MGSVDSAANAAQACRGMIKVHATCVEWGGGAVLLRGPPGSGKSDLGLRLIDDGGRLVADDQVQLDAIEGFLVASAPPPIAGKIEVRGLGPTELPEEKVAVSAQVALIADLVDGEVERLPEPARCILAGIDLPVLKLCPFEASAAAKVKVALGDCLRRAAEASSR